MSSSLQSAGPTLPVFESLDTRLCLDRTVSVAVSNNHIRITGDRFGNDVYLFAQETNDGADRFPGVRIAVSNSTRLIVDGKLITNESPAIAGEDGYDLTIDLGGGDDTLYISGGAVFGNVNVSLGAGNDLYSSNSVFQNIVVSGGDGEDSVSFVGGSALYRENTVSGNTSLFPGPGRDRIYFDGGSSDTPVAFGGKLLIEDRAGPLSVIGTFVTVRRQTFIGTGRSIDRIALMDSVFMQQAVIATNAGNDVIDVRRSIFRDERLLLPGAGNDQLIE